MKKKRQKFVLPPGVKLPPGLGVNLKPKVVTRLVELIRSKENLNDPQVVARMRAKKLKVSQGTVFKFREAMNIPARGKLDPVTINRTDQLIESGKHSARQIARILKEEGHQISSVSVQKRIKEKNKTPMAKALDTGDINAVAALVEKMDPAQRIVNFRVAIKARVELEHAFPKAKSESSKYKIIQKFKRIDLLLKALALFVPAKVLREYVQNGKLIWKPTT